MRAASRWAWGLTVFLGAAGCTAKPADAGERCTRSSQCKVGLACIDGRCSDDLDALQDQSTVPMLMPEPPGAGEPDDDAG